MQEIRDDFLATQGASLKRFHSVHMNGDKKNNTFLLEIRNYGIC